MATKWNHAYDFGFEVKSNDEHAGDVTGADLRKALQARLDSLSDTDLLGACDAFDSCEEEDKVVED